MTIFSLFWGFRLLQFKINNQKQKIHYHWKYSGYKGVFTGTFFWVTNATQSLPRTAMLVIPSAFTALNAYSVWEGAPLYRVLHAYVGPLKFVNIDRLGESLTDLEKTPFRVEYCNLPIISAASSRHLRSIENTSEWGTRLFHFLLKVCPVINGCPLPSISLAFRQAIE